MKNKYIVWLFVLFWKCWLQDGQKVIKIKGWRTALIENRYGERYTSTFIPRWSIEYWKGRKINRW